MPWKNAAILSVMLALAAGSPGVSAAPVNKPTVTRSIGAAPQPLKTASPSGPLLFHGYACGGECSIHQSGYRWAADHAIANPAQCQGTSESFIEGCRAYAGIDGPMGEREIFQDED